MKNILETLDFKKYTSDIFPFCEKRNHGERPQYYVQNSHQGIISKQEFLKAQNLMKKRYQNLGIRSPHLFTGRIQCPDCKHHFRYRFSSGKEYWGCPDRTNGISSCTAIHISELSLILAVLNFEAKFRSSPRSAHRAGPGRRWYPRCHGSG